MSRTAQSGISPGVTLFVCEVCELQQEGRQAGKSLLQLLRARNPDRAAITITGVDCLAVCERPVTVAFSAAGKWSYVVGDIDPDRDVDDVLAAARAVAASPYGVPEMKDRPEFFRRGVVSRTPPPGWDMPS